MVDGHGRPINCYDCIENVFYAFTRGDNTKWGKMDNHYPCGSCARSIGMGANVKSETQVELLSPIVWLPPSPLHDDALRLVITSEMQERAKGRESRGMASVTWGVAKLK